MRVDLQTDVEELALGLHVCVVAARDLVLAGERRLGDVVGGEIRGPDLRVRRERRGREEQRGQELAEEEAEDEAGRRARGRGYQGTWKVDKIICHYGALILR